MKEFVVIDHEGNPSLKLKGDIGEPESFATKAAADKRAAKLAQCFPGETIRTYQMVAETTAPVGRVMTMTTQRYKNYTKYSETPNRARR